MPLLFPEIMIIMSGLEPGTVVIRHAMIGHGVLPPPVSTNCHQCLNAHPTSLMLHWFLTC